MPPVSTTRPPPTISALGSEAGQKRDMPGFSAAALQWDELLTNQVELLANAEFASLAKLDAWQAATSVVDIGCGNGAYLSHLRDRHPEKNYTGIDPSNELIALARARQPQGITFCEGYAPISGCGTFDLILLRFVVQHVSDVQAFFRSLEPMAHAQSVIVLIEPSFAHSAALPKLDGLSSLIATYESACRTERKARAFIDDPTALRGLIGSRWRVRDQSRVPARLHRGAWNGRALRSVLHGWTSMLASFDRGEQATRVRTEIDAWIDGNGEHIEIALNITTLERAPVH